MPVTNVQAINRGGGIVTAPGLTAVSQAFTPTAGQTSFTLSAVPSAFVIFEHNGAAVPQTAFTFVGTAGTYVPANNDGIVIAVGDTIQCYIF